MTEPRRDDTAERRIPVIREIEIALGEPGDLGDFDLDDARIRIGLGRALMWRVAERQRYADELAAFTLENELAQAELIGDIDRIDARFDDYVRDRRKRLDENSLKIPGIGVWSSRRQNARWEIDNARLIESLSADDHAAYTEQPPPLDRKLKRDAYIKEVLDPLLLFDDDDNEIGIDAAAPPEGVTRVAEQINVNYSLNV